MCSISFSLLNYYFWQLCEEMGLQHVSRGIAPERYISVCKTRSSRHQCNVEERESGTIMEPATVQDSDVVIEQVSILDDANVFSKETISGTFT